MQYYSAQAPDLLITNLVDDGILRHLGAGNLSAAERRLDEMMAVARREYGCELAMITCSSVPLSMARALQQAHGVPVIKIDGPMARRAVETGTRIGVAVTFLPTIEPTSNLLRETAAALGREVEVLIASAPEAYQALFAGDLATHDRLLLQAVETLAGQGAEAIVLAQVSMARVQAAAQVRTGVPVLSSFDTSLEAIRLALGEARPVTRVGKS